MKVPKLQVFHVWSDHGEMGILTGWKMATRIKITEGTLTARHDDERFIYKDSRGEMLRY